MNGETPQHGVRLAPGISVPESVLEFSFSSSGGPGGQNVNKRATRCQLRVRLADLPLGPGQMGRLVKLASGAVTDAGELLISADEYRSQERNKGAAIERLSDLVRRALVVPKVRRPTKPSRGSKERRLESKRARALTKQRRRSED